MLPVDDLKDLVKLAESHMQTLMCVYNDEVKEYGQPKDDTVQRFNALFFQLKNACKCISDGLDGKFPWEV